MFFCTMLGRNWKVWGVNNVIEIETLTKEFDGLVAVDHINLNIGGRGDIWLSWSQWSREDNSYKDAMHYTESQFRLSQSLRI